MRACGECLFLYFTPLQPMLLPAGDSESSLLLYLTPCRHGEAGAEEAEGALGVSRVP